MTTRQFVSTKGDTWEWEETPEVVAALSQLHKTTKDTERRIANLNLKHLMKDKSITVEDYEKYSGEFFDKYFYVAKQLGEGAKAEDILKIMETLGALVMKQRIKDKVGPFGFNKKTDDGTDTDGTAED